MKLKIFSHLPSLLKSVLWTNLLISLLLLLIAVIFYFKSQPQIPIFYTLPRENQFLAAKEYVFIFPGLSLIMTFLHFLLLQFIKDIIEPLLLKIFGWSTICIQLILALALTRIILIII